MAVVRGVDAPGGDPVAFRRGQHVADPAGLQVTAQVPVTAGELVRGSHAAGTLASNARASIRLARAIFVPNLTKRVRRAELATVRASHAEHATELSLKGSLAQVPGAFSAFGVLLLMPLPHSRVEYYTTDTAWMHDFEEVVLVGEEEFPETVSFAFLSDQIYRRAR